MTDVEGFFDTPPAPPADPLRDDLIKLIVARNDATPRHLQREPGVSDVAHPCMRRLAHQILDTPSCNPQFDPLPSIIGTSLHAWLESAARHANMVLGRQRWLTETRVNVTTGLAGSVDLYDSDNAILIDWKCIGNTRFDKYRKQMNQVYVNQVHQYGKGFINAGLAVKTVAIAMIPRGKTLKSMHVWSEPYSDSIAAESISRRDKVIALLDDLQVEQHPERFEWLPTSGPDCNFCNWWRLRPRTPLECGGVNV